MLVVGGGPAGCSAAIELSRCSSLSVVVATIEPVAAPSTETLSAAASIELTRAGMSASEVAASRCFGIESAWGSARAVFRSSILETPGTAIHLDRRTFHRALSMAAQRAGARVLSGARFRRAGRARNGWSVWIVNDAGFEERFVCNFLIDATGRSSLVASYIGVRRHKFDALCGVSAIVETSWLGQTLLVESVPYGWWYVAPLSAGRAMICLVGDIDVIKSIGAFAADAWSHLAHRTALVGPVFPSGIVSRLTVHPCETSALAEVCGQGWLAVGDAAFVFDPLSSAGVHKALATGRNGGDAALRWMRGETSTLKRYAYSQQRAFSSYCNARRAHYSIERRWSSEPFWSRRIMAVPHSSMMAS